MQLPLYTYSVSKTEHSNWNANKMFIFRKRRLSEWILLFCLKSWKFTSIVGRELCECFWVVCHKPKWITIIVAKIDAFVMKILFLFEMNSLFKWSWMALSSRKIFTQWQYDGSNDRSCTHYFHFHTHIAEAAVEKECVCVRALIGAVIFISVCY